MQPGGTPAPASVPGDEAEEAGLLPEQGVRSPSHSIQVLQEAPSPKTATLLEPKCWLN